MSSQTYRILAVDDVPDNLLLLQTVLEAEGFSVDTATCGKSALNKAKSSRPDLVLLDLMMPGMNGYEVTQQLRQHDELASIPVLLITAHDGVTTAQVCQVGANGLVCKPIDLDDLLTKVKTFLQV